MTEEDFFNTHSIGDTYTMDGKPDAWKVAYYWINENGKTGEKYEESRALVERPIPDGTDFREVPLRYLTPTITKWKQTTNSPKNKKRISEK